MSCCSLVNAKVMASFLIVILLVTLPVSKWCMNMMHMWQSWCLYMFKNNIYTHMFVIS